MVCVTYSSEATAIQANNSLEDKDLKDLLCDINNTSPNGTWYITTRTVTERLGLFKRRRKVLHTLYAPVNGLEWQVINFAPNQIGGWSINQSVSRRAVAAYLYGYLAGTHDADKEQTNDR